MHTVWYCSLPTASAFAGPFDKLRAAPSTLRQSFGRLRTTAQGADKEGIVRFRMVGFDPENAYRKLKAVVDSLNAL